MSLHTRQKINGDNVPVKLFEPTGVTFSLFTSEEIKKLSVVEIRTPLIYDVIGHPLPSGLYDPVLGPLEEFSEPCGTCKSTLHRCPGHLAHIELPLPVVNPLFYRTIYQIVKLSCTLCYTTQLPIAQKCLLITQLRLLDAGYAIEAQEAEKYLPDCSDDESRRNSSATLIIVQEALESYYKSVTSATSNQLQTVQENSKIVQSLRNEYVNSFVKIVKKTSKCCNCKNPLNKFYSSNNKLFITLQTKPNKLEKTRMKSLTAKTILMPKDLKDIFRQLWVNESQLIKAMAPSVFRSQLEHPTDILFLDTIAVIPPNVRPVQVRDSLVTMHPQTNNYKPIVQDCVLIRHLASVIKDGDTELSESGKVLVSAVAGDNYTEKLYTVWQELQANVDHLMDTELNNTTNSVVCHGLKQVMEKKAGCIRMHMMGKRVNYAARSVITPDPNLDIEEIGVPEVFALVLTYPTPVTSWNVAELRKMIINGPLVHPGAVMVENEDGTLNKISGKDRVQRETIAKRLLTQESTDYLKGVKVVHRHLQNGDVLLLNRQPTLHRPSIMAHKARILKGEKTLRLNYANCKAYNADFDGDEMNAHFPQNELARSEAYHLVNVCNNYLVPKDGTPLSGLIQDHVVSGVRLTMRGRFFSRHDYQQLVYQALATQTGDIKLLAPSIVKPVALWSGKQIVSTVIVNVIPKGRYPINLAANSKIAFKAWENAPSRPWRAGGTPFSDPRTMSEAEVVIRQGQLLSGVLDKTHYGATPYGLVHCLYELYGGQCSSRLLSAFSKLFTAFLQWEGFTLGVEDILVVPEADAVRSDTIEESREVGDVAAAKAFDLVQPGEEELREKLAEALAANKAKWRVVVDRAYKTTLDGYTNVVNKACLPAGLLRKFPENNLQLMVQSGAKGSTVNTMQISCLLGQIELEGKRPPLMISGKSLPSFPKFETSPRAGGYIDGRFLTGIQPQEFFFHCMAGREGLIDTAVKTSRSGYLQRCLVKHLEGLVVNYDQTVRDSDGSVVQFYYGEDGLDVMKAQFLTPKQMPFLVDNEKAIIHKSMQLDSDEVTQRVRRQRKRIRKWLERNGRSLKECRKRVSPFTTFSSLHRDEVGEEERRSLVKKTGRSQATQAMVEMWRQSDEKTRARLTKTETRCPDPVMSMFQADRDFGTLTESMELLMENYLHKKHSSTADLFREIMSHKSMKSLCQAGEPVGLLAAQSIGEPSTQMTLNTFHFAGRGEMNVTLGIPRLREILMVASKSMLTPSMDIPFLTGVDNLEAKAEMLRKNTTRVTLSEVLESVEIKYHLQVDSKRRQVYRIKMNFLPHEMYKTLHSVTPEIILEFVENHFVRDLLDAIIRREKVSSSLLHMSSGEGRAKKDASNEDGDEETNKTTATIGLGEEHESSDEEDEDEDQDATMARTRARHNHQEYEDPDESDQDRSSGEMEDEGFEESQIVDEEEGSENVTNVSKPKLKKKNSRAMRRETMINSSQLILDYDYDTVDGSWCYIDIGLSLDIKRLEFSTLLRDIANRCILWEVSHIKRAFTYRSTGNNQLMFKTDGLNIAKMFQHYKLLDLNRLYTNDIHGMADTYGIEAARCVIVKEVQDVFKMYGITVDPRHLLLIADYMTFNGIFEPLNRKGMEKNASPLQQMSFESSLQFLKQATTEGKRDMLTSPSSRLMMGLPCKSGTGMFEVMQPVMLIH